MQCVEIGSDIGYHWRREEKQIMSQLMNCTICGQSVMNMRHCGCEAAVHEDLLSKVQKHLKKSPKKPLPEELVALILHGQYQSLQEFEEIQRRENDLEREKTLRQLGRDQIMLNFMGKILEGKV